MSRSTDVRPVGANLHFLPVETRIPLKFGAETLTSVTCARVRLEVEAADGRRASGWGETPLSVQWVWPAPLSYDERHEALKDLCRRLVSAWGEFRERGHALEVGHAFQEDRLPEVLRTFNESRGGRPPMPHLAALVCCSAFDIALHDAYGVVNGVPTYSTYDRTWMSSDLGRYLVAAEGAELSFAGRYPIDYLAADPPRQLPAWHLVGGKDWLHDSERDGSEPDDGYPIILPEWIERDGLRCLKIKLRGNDPEWDHERIVRVGEIGAARGVDWLSTDFNCTVTEPAYVNLILDRLMRDHPRIHGMILYVEQPFPYDLVANRIDVHAVSARKPLFMDESAHDWRFVRLGRSLGWTGVALKTCKTQTGALLSLCWARAHGMTLMVQDLTNPMLAQIPHVLLAAHGQTIMGVETNAMQFYPDASLPESRVHPGLYRRRSGRVDLSTIGGPGLGYRLKEIHRRLPEPEIAG